MLRRPSLLAQLPRPLDAEDGEIFAGDVFTVCGSEKRKRSELAVAIDREEVGIFDVNLARWGSRRI
jgi:hypothetical protein